MGSENVFRDPPVRKRVGTPGNCRTDLACLIQRGRRKDGTSYRRYNWDKTLIRVSRVESITL